MFISVRITSLKPSLSSASLGVNLAKNDPNLETDV